MSNTCDMIVDGALRQLFTKPDEYRMERPEHFREHDSSLAGFDRVARQYRND